MIVVQGRELLIPDADRYIGKTPGALTETRQFKLPKVTASAIDLSGMNFYLRLQYQNDGLDTVALIKAVDGDYIILTWNITLAELKAVGPVAIQIRVTDSATVRWTSYSASLYIDRHLSIPVSYAGQLTELEQIEQDHAYMLGVVDELKDDIDFSHTSEAWAIGKRNGVDVPSSDETYHNNSKYYKEESDAHRKTAERYANGKENGTDVTSGTGYHDNSKYYKELADDHRKTAEAYAKGTVDGAAVTSGQTGYQDNAKYYKEQVQSRLNQIDTNTSNIAVQTARIDNIAQLPAGSTSGDAELMDIRVGADGVTYTSAGAAVRANDSLLKSHLEALGTYALTQDISANTSTNIQYAITKGQTYVLTIDLAIGTRTATIRTKKTAADSTYIETLYSGGAVVGALVTATADAEYLYFTSTSDATLSIELLSSRYAYNVGKTDMNTLYDRLYSNLELFDEMTVGYIIPTNQGIGGTVNPNTLTATNQGAYGVFAVSKNDTFIISGAGGSSGRLWCFTDGTYKILSVANVSINVTNLTIIAPADGYLIVNFSGMLIPGQAHSLIKVHGKDEIAYLNNSVADLATEVYPYSGIDMFRTVACLGDSFTQGGMRNSANTDWVTALKTYPEVLAARHGITVNNYGYGGSTAKSYITDMLPTVLSATANDLYILSWGLNDAYNSLTIGTISDIHDEDYTLNADSFYGNYGKIVAMLKEAFPLSRFVIFGPWLVGGIYTPYNAAAQAIAEHFGIGYCNPEDDNFFTSSIWTDTLVGSHPTQVTYTGMAYAIERLLSKDIVTRNLYYRYAGLETV